MRIIRLLLLLLAVAAALGLALVRPLPGRATGEASSASTPTPAANPLPPLRKTLRRAKRRLAAREREAQVAFGSRVVKYAKRFLGVPYVYGGVSPRSGFDCSGLVRYVYSHFGVSLPHSSFADLWRGRRVSRWHLRPGDLVFFYDAGHVGIYVGRQRFIDAPHGGAVVRISTMGAYSGYYGARRLRAG